MRQARRRRGWRRFTPALRAPPLMCGFAGVYEYATREGRVSRELVARMSETLRHRGPDGGGAFVSEDARVGLGHRRLAVVDVAGGAQPLHGRHGECLVYNGEIYNYPRLRSELEAQGARFDTRCDTEVVMRAYERDGVRCLQRLEGMFAFALWDPGAGRLLLARDRIGEKPLYLSDAGGRLVFGSEVKALLEHPAIHAELDRSGLSAYLAHLVSPGPRTLYRGIRKLAPGEMAVCDARGLRVSRYWEALDPRRWEDTTLGDAAARVRAALERSIEERLMSDVPLGVLLSGGLDSTTLVALLRERARGLATFCVGFDRRPDLDERDEARRVARHFATDHHEIGVSEADAVSLLPRLIRHQDEPLGDPVSFPLHFLCALAATTGVKVVLGGEGSDELFWGYRRYQKIVRAWPLIRAARRLPRVLLRTGARAIPRRRQPLVREFAEGLAAERLAPMHMPAGLPRRERELALGGAPADGGWQATARSEGDADPLATLSFDTQEYEFQVRLPERLLMRLDRFSMANGVEARVPFLAPELVELVYRLPPRLKLHHAETKLVLRRAVADAVPEWVLARPKQAFATPVDDWFRARMGALLRSLAREDALRESFDPAGLAELLREDRALPYGLALWPLLNFALWHMAWIEGRDLDEVVARA